MSEVFGVTVDALLKGDAEVIKEMIDKEDQRDFERLGRVYTILFVIMVITPVPLAKFMGFLGLGIWVCLAGVTVAMALLVEKKKKELNIQSYREIAAFLEGKGLDEIEKVKEEAKRPYQKFLLVLGAGIIALIINLLFLYLWK